MQPGNIGVFPSFDGHGPFAQLTFDGRIAILPRLQIAVVAALDGHHPTIETGVHACHGASQGFLAAWIAHYGGGAYLGAAFDEHLSGHLERFAELHAGGEDAAFLGGGDVHDVDTAKLARLAHFDGGSRRLAGEALQGCRRSRCCGAGPLALGSRGRGRL